MLTKAQVETKAQVILQTYGTNVSIKSLDDVSTVVDDLYEEALSKIYQAGASGSTTIKVRWDFSPTEERLTSFGNQSDAVQAILTTTKKELRDKSFVDTNDKCTIDVNRHKIEYNDEEWDVISVKESGQWDDSFLMVKIGVAKR